MGLCNSPDFFQEKINELFNGLEYIRVYIDDNYLNKVKTILKLVS